MGGQSGEAARSGRAGGAPGRGGEGRRSRPALTVRGLSPGLEHAVRARIGQPELDVVVAGAGRRPTGRFLELEQSQWDEAVAAAKSAFRAAQAAAAGWEAEGVQGRVVFAVSTASLRPVHGDALDATVGGFLTTIGQVGAVELGGKGITVNTVVHGRLEGEDAEGFVEGVPAGRLGNAGEVADAIAFLAAPSSGYVNGAVLAVDGGFWITKSAGGSPLLR
jgi:NAD(P)-dependent dehydrogenase (short-subunit alcohol dehydrogenase family)